MTHGWLMDDEDGCLSIEIMLHNLWATVPFSYHISVNGASNNSGTPYIASAIASLDILVNPWKAKAHAEASIIRAQILWILRIFWLVLSLPKSGCRNMAPINPTAKELATNSSPIFPCQLVKCGFPQRFLLRTIAYKPPQANMTPSIANIPWLLVLVYPPIFLVTADTPAHPIKPHVIKSGCLRSMMMHGIDHWLFKLNDREVRKPAEFVSKSGDHACIAIFELWIAVPQTRFFLLPPTRKKLTTKRAIATSMPAGLPHSTPLWPSEEKSTGRVHDRAPMLAWSGI